MSLSALEYIRHILDEIKYIASQAKGLNKNEFVQDETLKRAFTRSMEIIGEATKKIPEEFKQRYPHIQWRAIAGMRDRLIHGYFGIDYEIVWDVVTNKIPTLQRKIEQILQNELNTP